MSGIQEDSTVTIILSEPMAKIIDVFRDIDQNFMAGSEFLLGDVSLFGSFGHLFSNILAHAEDEVVTSVLMLHETCVRGREDRFLFKPIGSPFASSDEIALLILLSAAQSGRFGLAGEAALRLGCRESTLALRSAYEFASWLSETGIEIGSIDSRLMQRLPSEMADIMIGNCLEKLDYQSPASRFSPDYIQIIRG